MIKKKETLVIFVYIHLKKILKKNCIFFVSVEPVAQGGEYVKEINSLTAIQLVNLFCNN